MKFDIDAVSDKVIADVVFAVMFPICQPAPLKIPAVYRATKYLSPKLTVKATRSHEYSGGDYQRSVILTVGRPNLAERAFIKEAKRAGASFPIKKLHRLIKVRLKKPGS